MTCPVQIGVDAIGVQLKVVSPGDGFADEDQEALLVEAVDLVGLDYQWPRPIFPALEGLAARLEAIHVGVRRGHSYDTSGKAKKYD
jgi:hypothetical protein